MTSYWHLSLAPVLALYVAAETVFWGIFHWHILPTCNRHYVEPQVFRGYEKDQHRLMLRICQRMERTCRLSGKGFLQTFIAYVNEWFHHDDTEYDPTELPRKDNIDELFSWAFFGRDHGDLEPSMHAELQRIYDMLETRYGVKFAPGINPGLRPMRLSLDPLEPSYRPLFIYFLFGSMQVTANLFLSSLGFSCFTTSNGVRYWYRPRYSNTINKDPRLETQLPLLFFHGIAPGGIALYLPMLLWGVGRGGRPLMLFVNPAISLSMCLKSPTEQETVEAVWEAVQTHLDSNTGVSVFGHSFGSCQLTWLLHSSYACKIRQVVLVDPVSVLLSEPDVMSNFLYTRKAMQRRSIGVVANELYVEYYLRRQFAWYNSELWLEDIPSHCKVVVCLSDQDEILNVSKVKREIDIQIAESGAKLDFILWQGGHAYCVFRPKAWRQLRLTMWRQEQLIAKQELCCK